LVISSSEKHHCIVAEIDHSVVSPRRRFIFCVD
jgi:hypothetical protein